MSKLNQVTRGKVKLPHLILIYGVDGVGKSTFAAKAPNPIFLGSEKGTNNLDVSRYPTPHTWADVMAGLVDLRDNPHDYKTLAVDSLDWLEMILWQSICKDYNAKSIELAAGGYGKGYVEAVVRWDEFQKITTEIREKRKMNIVFIGHATVVNFQDPTNQVAYQRYELKLDKRAAARFREYVDCVLFANHETFVKKDGTATRAFGSGARTVRTERQPGFDAKNRFGLPPVLALEWDEVAAAIDSGDGESVEAVRARLDGLLSICTDEAIKKMAAEYIEKAGADVARLNQIANRLTVRLGEVK